MSNLSYETFYQPPYFSHTLYSYSDTFSTQPIIFVKETRTWHNTRKNFLQILLGWKECFYRIGQRDALSIPPNGRTRGLGKRRGNCQKRVIYRGENSTRLMAYPIILPHLWSHLVNFSLADNTWFWFKGALSTK